MNWLSQNYRRLAAVGFGIVALGGAVAVLTGPGVARGLWSYGTGFIVVRWAAYAAAAGGLICLLSVLASLRGAGRNILARAPLGIIGVALAALIVIVPYIAAMPGNPPIHDITTDLEDPPVFVDALKLRADAKAVNPAEYLGEMTRGDRHIKVADLQKEFFPDIQPINLTVAPAEAFSRAAKAVRDLKWTVTAEKPDEGRIEAFDRTKWFGFVDDVVIRIRPNGDGSRVDIRSVSRVGTGDRGLNAQRIRKFVRAISS
jgi:uncharacterized protein (DUF1499 family)